MLEQPQQLLIAVRSVPRRVFFGRLCAHGTERNAAPLPRPIVTIPHPTRRRDPIGQPDVPDAAFAHMLLHRAHKRCTAATPTPSVASARPNPAEPGYRTPWNERSQAVMKSGPSPPMPPKKDRWIAPPASFRPVRTVPERRTISPSSAPPSRAAAARPRRTRRPWGRRCSPWAGSGPCPRPPAPRRSP